MTFSNLYQTTRRTEAGNQKQRQIENDKNRNGDTSMAEKSNANIGFEKQIWDAACVLWGHIPAAEYRKVIVGLIFLRYISSAFKKKYDEL